MACVYTSCLLVLVLVLVPSYESKNDDKNNDSQSACADASNRKYCEWVLSEGGKASKNGSKDVTEFAIRYSLRQAKLVQNSISGDSSSNWRSMQSQAVADCSFLYTLTADYLNSSLVKLSNSTSTKVEWKSAVYIQSYLSAALTNQGTCLEGLGQANVSLDSLNFAKYIANSSDSVGSTLALNKKYFLAGKGPAKRNGHKRRLLSKDDDFMSEYGSLDHGFPSWLSRADRRRLTDSSGGDGVLIGDYVTVAQDGSGNYTTVNAAVNAAPNKSADRFVIFVTAGVYFENVDIPKNKYNIMFIGDGIDVTVITGNRSNASNWTTFNSATFSAVGVGFLARNMTFENTAGAVNHQAVALQVGSDQSAFFRCSFKGYQDTLYAHSLRQFYRECDIYGTVDFIFGNAAAVFQNCNLYARKPMNGQKNVYTAQGRTDPNQNTGTSIQNCNITAAPELVPVISSFPTYLGRPWKQYSRTVYIQSYLDSLIQPAGWLEWSGDFALSTLYYGEYNNSGPGADTSQRVAWPGYHVMTISDAQNFTVSSLMAGDTWIPNDAVPYDAGLL